jgi:hypothetical protein
MTSKFNEATLSDFDDSTEEQTKETVGAYPINDWLQ